MQEITKQSEKSPEQAAYDSLDFQYNKMVSLNFTEYCFKNRSKLELDLDLFKTEEDKEEVLHYIWNNLYVALSSHNPPPNEDYGENRAKYNAFLSKIQQTQDTFTLETKNNHYILPINHFEKVVFYHNYGVDVLPTEAKVKLIGKDFIDGGAYIGDTALILNQYQPNKIYAFEPTQTNFELMQKTLALNKIHNVVPVSLALGNNHSTSYMFTWGNASFLSVTGNQKVNVTTIDNFRAENNLQIGLIKMDIEGAEYSAIKGAEETIKHQKPVLLISLYHTGLDFFEIPKLLKNWVPTYQFRFLNLHKLAPILERVLVAYQP